MSFQTGLSGLNASSRNLDVIGNNIANANTTGMKSSRAEFGDMVAASLGAGGGTSQLGIGVNVTAISQQFSQGNITITGNNLDVAINGGGFFQLTQSDGSPAYTRDGAFKLDRDGYIKTNSGAYLMGYPESTSSPGTLDKSAITTLQMPTGASIQANPTTTISAELNLDARALDATDSANAGLTASPRSTYGTSLNVYDAQGVASPANLYFVKTDTVDNSWDIYGGIDGTPTGSTYSSLGSMTFAADGSISGPALGTGYGITLAGGSIPSLNPNETSGYIPDPITLDLSGVTQFGSSFAISNLSQDGYASGDLTGLTIGSNGYITASYSNGQSQTAGAITLSEFRNVQGLESIGGNAWVATYASGDANNGNIPGDGKYGALQSGALEDSNVDLTAELVNMMTAQRAYQANAQTIKTQDQVLSTLVNLR